MTMDITPEQVRYIADQLETHTVTFHTIARDLNLHVLQAKRILHAYYSSSKERLSALYLVSGIKGAKTILKVLDNLNETTLNENFDLVLSIHVYSISQNKYNFSLSDIALEELRRPVDFGNLGKYYDFGMIRGRELKEAQMKHSEPARPEAAKARKQEPKKEVDKAKTEAKPKLQYTSRKEKPQPSLLSNYVSRKDEKKQKEKQGVGEKRSLPDQGSGYQYKSRKLEKLQPKERVIVSEYNGDNDHDEEEPVPERKSAQAKSNNDLNSLFLDDLSDFSDREELKQEVAENDEPIMVEELEEPLEEKEATQPKATVAPLLPQDSSLRSLASKSPTPQTGEGAEKIDTRASEEPVTTVDEDGYIVTKKKTEPKKEPSKPSRKPISSISKLTNSSKKKSDGAKKQASLMSFFDRR